MPEPISHSAAGALAAGLGAAAVAPPLAGISGFEYIALGWAFVGGCIYLMLMGRLPIWWQAFVSVFISTVMGAALAHWFAKPSVLMLVHTFEALRPWQPEALEPVMGFIALIVGIFIQKAMPGLMTRVGILSEGKHA
jgi:hypothetical protein